VEDYPRPSDGGNELLLPRRDPVPIRELLPAALATIARAQIDAHARRWNPRSIAPSLALVAGGAVASEGGALQATHNEVKHPRGVPTFDVGAARGLK
jgi:hypothetical protein